MHTPCFIADVHLGRLARLLRMLGIDVAYSNAYTAAAMLQGAAEQGRVVLSKNAALSRLRPAAELFVIHSSHTLAQLEQVLASFNLLPHTQPFSRCMVCNGLLKEAEKSAVESLLPLNTKLYYNQFWQCTDCHRVYWKGPHYQRMLQVLEAIKRKEE